MSDDWILGVLSDLKTFAEQNGLTALAGRLDDTHRVASLELALRQRQAVASCGRYGQQRPIADRGGADT
jgi:hypothetical protein